MDIIIPRVKVAQEKTPSQRQLRDWKNKQRRARKYIAINAKKVGIMNARIKAKRIYGNDWRDEMPTLEMCEKAK